MESVNIYEAKTRLSQLVDKAASGEDVVLSRNGKPLVRITALAPKKRTIKFGVLSHQTLYYGKTFTVVRNPKDELKTGTFHAMCKQLGIRAIDL